MIRNPASRFSFIRRDAETVLLFVDGECFACSGGLADFAAQLCAQDRLEIGPGSVKSELFGEVIVRLLNQGSLGFDL